MKSKDFIELDCLDSKELASLLDFADEVKKNPVKYSKALAGRSLLMLFEKLSLRTRLSFEVGMTQLGGHAIYYDIATSSIGKKESVADAAKTVSRYVDLIMARLYSHEKILELAGAASVPVINALTDYAHPCQVLADLQTLREEKGRLKGLKLAYLGDGNNNVTHSLIYGCSLAGMHITVGCPKGREYEPSTEVVRKAGKIASSTDSGIKIISNAMEAVKDADVVYTDSWMSYHIPEDQKEKRVKAFMPYQINGKLMKLAKKDALFMHCLPAQRGMEVSSEVIDGLQSVVFDEAENRLHAQKALMLTLLGINQ
jgi:ornithine carbamoyltransferase